MGWRDRQQHQLPTVNLVPMLDVLMTVLTFFIIISMSLTGQQILNVTLPSLGAKTTQDLDKSQPVQEFVVGLNKEGKIVLENQLITNEELKLKMLDHLIANPKGRIVLKADRDLDYRQVTKALKQLGKIGGERVSLAVESQ